MNKDNKKIRPPVVVVLGHVDHGKTSILDYIRKSKVAEGESGGITQHMGAYQVEQSGKLITFIDTPGHEAFSAMRSRGVNVADIAILVVAADDAVMPQTKEAIKIIKKANLPYIVAINKVDKPEASVQNVKNKLTENEVLLEGYGGKIPNVEVSAKTGQGIDELLEVVNLVAEVEEISFNEGDALRLVVVEASMDSQRGAMATLLVKEGTIQDDMMIAGSTTWARVRQMEDFLGNPIKKAGPSTPVVVVGFQDVPQVGDKFVEVGSQKEAEERIERKTKKSEEGHLLEVNEGQKVVNIILRSDVDGTLEAVRNLLRGVENEEVALRVLQKGVGEITDSDIRLASSGNALVVGFRVKTNSLATNLAQQQNVTVVTYDTIYDLVSGVRGAISNYIDPETKEEILGQLKILKIFRTEPSRMIVGGRVVDGKFKNGASLKVSRDGVEVGQGRIKQLKSGEKDVSEAKKGEEVGILFDGAVKLQENDVLEASEKVTTHTQL
ncbi:MAG: translation initiation factor IF-2 [Candidatus Spechtbacteria bacterium RIFCSPLOWO2_12_FULL_38_22]|uniref:Translation initiation factor IF-2 n=1 Tax=Candidatus Spechtbacteria bacterium RIFCSPLOWO2_12_FULL_38_22 TaxID=1802165 RepID=A0A1G2HHY5_9BACT|nr:MAG: translation initiation factor IF-2 [Candidatus Spechtbacteria bacterium RIFCSPHIGHO2_01_FULL_38_11]OGZ60533.1 MAG: translation initiation factor IF-2 [Candidatus Spechtbacteria bacterium RIFCSPLOWO2_01_FULL_38_20]OGZ62009.1 MAG: translation initiation factor IF-2 [Candidatus Spechtbacteria bacterium RIFCSPLOWO2_12_FULL_38_22]